MPLSPPPFTRKGWRGGRVLGERDCETRQRVGARQRVIHEAAGQHLAGARLVHRALEQRLADALRDAAMHLAVQDERVDRLPDVVDRGVAHDFDRAGLGIDFEFADRSTGRVGRHAAGEGGGAA